MTVPALQGAAEMQQCPTDSFESNTKWFLPGLVLVGALGREQGNPSFVSCPRYFFLPSSALCFPEQEEETHFADC